MFSRRVLVTLFGGVLLQGMAAPMQVWLSSPAKSARFELQKESPVFGAPTAGTRLAVEPGRTFQTMEGFGFALTGGSARHLAGMTPGARAALLQELFAHDGTNIGISCLRISIGASDLDDRPFSYDDLPRGETDAKLEKFSLAPDRDFLIPMLREILAIHPQLSIMASPWSPPAWMKDNEDTRGGKLRPELYSAYAQYFVKYLKGMEAEGIRVASVTVQNEPLHPGNNPSLLMLAAEQAAFVKGHLGPALQQAGLKTRIIIYDHNADRPDYPLAILNDPEARRFVDGSAFHLYAGNIAALSRVHEAYPDKHLYFTEQWIGAPGRLASDLAWHSKQLVIGAPRNWARMVLEWNLTSNPQLTPHTDRGGCSRCLGGVTIDGDKVVRNPGYYIIAHASKFVRPGSVRIESSEVPGLPNVAFKTPVGSLVLIVLNEKKEPQEFPLESAGKAATLRLDPGAVATYVW